jgi:hypothetical protein
MDVHTWVRLSKASAGVAAEMVYRNHTFWNGQIGEIRPLIQWGLPGLFSRVFVTPDQAVSVFNDTAGLARTGAEEVLVELAELFSGIQRL